GVPPHSSPAANETLQRRSFPMTMPGPAMNDAATRIETDSMGEVRVPADRYWGAQTQRSLENFRIGGERMPVPLVRALGLVKQAAARANTRLGVLDKKIGQAIDAAAGEV